MAIVRCYEEKAQLVSIADEAEQSYLVSLVGDICTNTAVETCSKIDVRVLTLCLVFIGRHRSGGCGVDWNENVWGCRWRIYVSIDIFSRKVCHKS